MHEYDEIEELEYDENQIEECEDMTETEFIKYLDSLKNPLDLYREICFTKPIKDTPTFSSINMNTLIEKGYLILDNWMPLDVCKTLRSEAISRMVQKQLLPAHDLDKNSFLDPLARSDVTQFLCQNDPVFAPLLTKMGNLYAELVTCMALAGDMIEYQLAIYPSNSSSHYDRHRDSMPEPGMKRKVTCICYLNPDWTDADGGCLRLFVDDDIDVQPLAGRLLVFLSGAIDHAVMDVGLDNHRVAVTAWMH